MILTIKPIFTRRQPGHGRNPHLPTQRIVAGKIVPIRADTDAHLIADSARRGSSLGLESAEPSMVRIRPGRATRAWSGEKHGGSAMFGRKPDSGTIPSPGLISRPKGLSRLLGPGRPRRLAGRRDPSRENPRTGRAPGVGLPRHPHLPPQGPPDARRLGGGRPVLRPLGVSHHDDSSGDSGDLGRPGGILSAAGSTDLAGLLSGGPGDRGERAVAPGAEQAVRPSLLPVIPPERAASLVEQGVGIQSLSGPFLEPGDRGTVLPDLAGVRPSRRAGWHGRGVDRPGGDVVLGEVTGVRHLAPHLPMRRPRARRPCWRS